jgi:uncharacterized protein (DUF1330 family)
MPAYIVADIDVHDPDAYAQYAAMVDASLEPFEGRFLVRGGGSQTLEGDWRPRRLVVLQFPSAGHARGWYESQDYGAAKTIRQQASTGSMVLADGFEP